MRTVKGVDVDLILKNEDVLYPFEVKTSMTPNKTFSRHLLSFAEAETIAENSRIIYPGQSYPKLNRVEYVNFKDLEKYLDI